MDQFIRVHSKTINLKVRASLSGHLDNNMRDNGKITRWMARVILNPFQVVNQMDNLKETTSLVIKVLSIHLMTIRDKRKCSNIGRKF